MKFDDSLSQLGYLGGFLWNPIFFGYVYRCLSKRVYRPRQGSLLFGWGSTPKITVSGEARENARHTSSNGFTGVRGDRRMVTVHE